MNNGYKKYIPFEPVKIRNRKWPSNTLKVAPTWCSVDLRDGNQALVEPMNKQEKIEMFKLLVSMGIKEIEVGFPSASETEYEILRTLIEENLIPDDVTIQVLVQSREHLIDKTFEAIKGAKNVIIHLYNSISELHREVVFGTSEQGIIDIAVSGTKLIKELAEKETRTSGMNIKFEYSPENFSESDVDMAVKVCDAVIKAYGATADNKVIINLPSTVECSTPNCYADQIELFCRKLKNRKNAIISLHPHNDRGTAIAATELGLLAGAERVEGTLFGNGERTGNTDIITLALNMYTQSIDPKLDLHNLNEIKEIYERTTKMQVSQRQPYAGDLVFTAFSGSHQDAINKGKEHLKNSNSPYWKIPYIPIDPADIGREYEPTIRINSQSGKGGAAFVLHNTFGYNLPKAMHPEFGKIVKEACDKDGAELSVNDIFDLFKKEYIDVKGPYTLINQKFFDEENKVRFEGLIKHEDDEPVNVEGSGNGPIDAFFNALSHIGITGYSFDDYSEHAISIGSNAKAVSYIQLSSPNGNKTFGVGISHNINYASIRGVLCAINRDIRKA